MKFTPNMPVKTREPMIVVDAGLPVGSHRFRLVVINDRGRESKPVEIVVRITDQRTSDGTLIEPRDDGGTLLDPRRLAILVDASDILLRR